MNTEADEQVKYEVDRQHYADESARPSVTINRKPLPLLSSAHPLPPIPNDVPDYEPDRPALPPRPSLQNGNSENRSPLRVNTNTIAVQSYQPAALSGSTSVYNPTGDYVLSPSPQAQHIPYATQASSNSYNNHQGTTMMHLNHTQLNTTNAISTNSDKPHRIDPTFPTITIIRRDPTSGSQWNIGTINTLDSTFSRSNVKPLCVELTTPGYGRFVRSGFESPRPGSASTDVASIRRAIASATASPASVSSPDSVTQSFSRIIDFRKMNSAELRRAVYQRTDSSDSTDLLDVPKSGIEKNVLAFDSPWHGLCVFVNAIDGKTLKLKHTVTGNASSGESITANIAELRFNLGWSILSNIKESRNRRQESEPDRLPISQLLENKKDRFRKSFQHLKERSRESFQRSRSAESYDNEVLRDLSNVTTPTRNNLNDNAWQKPNRPAVDADHYGNDYPRSYSSAHPTSSEDNEEEEGRLSLKLGRERAGGGFRGHSAKLGKLVIENEGLKMCDLVVGAAMGVWWQHYGG